MKRRKLALALVSAPLLLVACYGPPPGIAGDDDETPPPDDCEIAAEGGKTPGFPFDVETFRGEVLPVVTASCGTAGCHQGPNGIGGFVVFADAAQDDCDFTETFKQVGKQVTLTAPASSRLLQAPSGGSTTHPRVLESTTPGYATLKAYIDDAVLRQSSGGDPPPNSNPHDANVFKTVIQPMLDGYQCTTCHAAGAGGFQVIANAAGADLDANFLEVTSGNDLATPEKSRVYFKGLNSHSGSKVFSPADAKKFLDWVTAAAAAP